MSHLPNTIPGRAADSVHAAPPLWKRLLCLFLAFQIALPLPALAGTVAFSSIPLARASTPAAPNILFILDDSGSMDRAYMPDAIAENGSLPDSFAYCWDSGDDDSGQVDQEPDACQSRDVPYRTGQINGMYYNPAVTYSPGVTAAGVSMGNQTTFTAVQTDPYESPASTTNLLSYSEARWCDAGGTCVTNTTADANGNYYRYPDGVYVYRSGTSTTTNPHYFSILPTEYCTDETQVNCTASTTPTTIAGVVYATPATVRWCKYTGGSSMDYAAVDYTACQAKRVGQFQYPKYLGFTSPGGQPTSSYATIRITANPTALDQIVSVMVGATNLIPGVTLSGYTNKVDVAEALAYWISNKNQGYIACSGSGTTSIGGSSSTNPPGCNRSGSVFRNIVPNPGSAPTDTVYIIPTTGVGSFTPATGTAYNSPPLPVPVVNGVPAVIATKATGSITIGDSGNDRGVRISRTDIGVATVFTGATLDATGGTNSSGERNALANLVRDTINSGGSGYVATVAPGSNVVSIEAPATGSTYNGRAIAVTTSQQAIGTISIAQGSTPQPVRISNVAAGATTLMNTNVDAAGGLNSQAKIDAFASALRTAIQTNAGTAAHGFTATVTSGVDPAVVTITSSITNGGANALARTLSGGRRSTITLSNVTPAVSLSSVSDGVTLMTSGATVSSTSGSTLASDLVSKISANGYSAMLNTATTVYAYQPLGSGSTAIPSIVQSPLPSAGSGAQATIFIGPAAGFDSNQRVNSIAIGGGGCASTDANMLTGQTSNSSSASALATNIAARDDGAAPRVSNSGASIVITGPIGTSMAGCTVTVTKNAATDASFGLAANPPGNTAVTIGPLSPAWSAATPTVGTASSAIAFATLAPTGITLSGMAGGLVNSTSAPFISTATMAGGLDAVPARLIPNSVNGFQGAQDIIISVRSNHAKFARVDIVPGNNSYPYPGTATKASTRTDCAGATCTYNEEMTNFANWYAYYRTRLLTMKTAAGRAFKDIDGSFRVGYMTIHPNTTDYLNIDYFEDTPTHGQSKLNQKSDWYAQLYAQDASGGTPLRSALATAGRIYAGRNPLNFGTTDDPVQFACQQNFTILTTDGMWNTDSDSSAKRVDGSTDIGNTDNAAVRPYFDGNPGICPSATASDCNGTVNGTSDGKFSSKSTLADVAYYYYNTDLRASGLSSVGASSTCSASTSRVGTNLFNSCCGQPKGGVYNDVCTNEVKGAGEDTANWQHMTTFTLGLGVDGALLYKDDYKTAATGDYSDILAGRTVTVNGSSVTANWPQVKADDPTTADDLWHAAVNGHGTYYSARDPSSLSTGLANTLSNIAQLTGAGAAAATSNLEPQAGDNFAYVGSYTTILWTGNLEARTIDIGTGTVSPAAIWCVEDVAASTVNGVAVPGCSGRLKLKVSANSDTRQIHLFDPTDATDKLRDFTAANLTVAETAYFDNAQQGHVTTGLSQYPLFSAAKIANATTANLVNYLRGQSGYEDEASNADADKRLYRDRERTFGDVIGSQPVYVKKPFFSYLDTGYQDYKTASAAATRDAIVYIGGNDGMLHALDALTGDERWSYIPSQMLPNLYRLADASYSDNHRYYVDGSVAVGDVFDGTNWKTILVGGFNSGGRGYYALDITVPGSPKGLWEFSTASKYTGDVTWDADVGYSLGNPLITKLSDGTWTVMFSSGYNNVSPGNGRGYLYVLDALSGSVIRKIEAVHKTGTVGDTTTPSNLGRISAWVDTPDVDNTARYVYAGDLQGNVWRFDPNLAQNTTDYIVANPKRLAILKDSSGVVQPITTRPELGLIGNTGRMIMFGTGKYLEASDVSNTQQQTIYGIADRYDEINGGVATTDGVIPNVRDPDYTVAQTMSLARSLTGKAVDLTSPLDFSGAVSQGKTNWLVDLPESRERVNVDPQLVSGTLLVASNIPSSSSCAAGGTSYINFMDYLTGGFVGSYTSPSPTSTNTASSSRLGAIVVGFVVLKLSSGKAVNVTLADSPTPQNVGGATFGNDGQDGLYSNTRTGWRELPVE